MESNELDNIVFARFFPNENIFEQLEKVCAKHRIETAVVVSGIGQLKSFELGYFKEKGNYVPEKFETPHELVNLSGMVSKTEKGHNFHLHAVLSNEKKGTVGGHLIKGIVEITNEIVLLKSAIKVKRIREESSGLMGLFLE